MSAVTTNISGEKLPCDIHGQVKDFQFSDFGRIVKVLRPDDTVEAFMSRAGKWITVKSVKSFPWHDPEGDE